MAVDVVMVGDEASATAAENQIATAAAKLPLSQAAT